MNIYSGYCHGGFVQNVTRLRLRVVTIRCIYSSITPCTQVRPPRLFFHHLRPGTKKRDWIPLPPDHLIGHISDCGWSWRTIERSIPSHFAALFQRLFHIGAATCSRGARSVDKGQIWGEFEVNFWVTPALGIIPRPRRPPAH